MGDKKRALCVGLLDTPGHVDFAAAVDCRIRVRYNKNQKGCE